MTHDEDKPLPHKVATCRPADESLTSGVPPLNCIAHILSMVPYQDATPPPLKLPPRRPPDESYVRPPKSDQNFVPDVEL
jgi:hypothetical protein